MPFMLHVFHRGGLFYQPNKQNHKTYKPGIILTTDINSVSVTSQYRNAADRRNLSHEHGTKLNNANLCVVRYRFMKSRARTNKVVRKLSKIRSITPCNLVVLSLNNQLTKCDRRQHPPGKISRRSSKTSRRRFLSLN